MVPGTGSDDSASLVAGFGSGKRYGSESFNGFHRKKAIETFSEQTLNDDFVK